VIDTPLGPPGWEGARAHLVRIVDPLGRAVAWFVPDFGGICVGFAVRPSGRREGEWIHVLHSVGPDGPRHSSGIFGLGVCYAPRSVPLEPVIADPLGSPLPTQPWQFIERDPTAVILETTVSTDAGDYRAGADAAVRLRLTAGLDDGALTLNLDAWHHGGEPIPLQLGFQAIFATDLFGRGISMGLVRAPAEQVNERFVIPHSTVLAPGEYELCPCIENGMIPPISPTDQALPPRARLIVALGGSYRLVYPPRPNGENALALLACAPPTSVVTPPGDARFRTGLSLTAVANDEDW